MIHRTYFVVMPTWTIPPDGGQGGLDSERYLDIVVEGFPINVAFDTTRQRAQGGPISGRPGAGMAPLIFVGGPDVFSALRPVYYNLDSPHLSAWLTARGWPATPAMRPFDVPVGWFGHPEGGYWEWRSRVLPLPTKVGGANFVARQEEGWAFSIYPLYPCHFRYTEAPSGAPYAPSWQVPDVQFSRSLAPYSTLADPTYGPVVRLVNSPDVCSVHTAQPDAFFASTYIIHLDVMEAKDEDRDQEGVGST